MGIALTVLIGASLIGLVLFLTRENWLYTNKKEVAGRATTASIQPPPAQATRQPGTAPQQTPTTTQQTGKSRWWKWGAAVLVVLVLLWGWQSFSLKIADKTSISSSPSSLSGIPLEVARLVVCECESGCRQFEDDGKTPLKNKGIPGKVEPSSAFGKYQFLGNHREPATKLGFNLNTEDGQDKYFEYLYGKEGFGPWDHDEQYGGGRACWGPKLAALGFEQDGMETLVVEAPINSWGEIKKLDPSRKASFFGHGKKYRIRWNGSTEEDLPRETGVASKTPAITYFFQAQSREKEPVKITVIVGN